MALPTTDPKVVPTITNVDAPGGGYTIDGRAYSLHVTGTNLSIFCKPWTYESYPVILTDYADLVYFLFDKDNFYIKTQFYFQANTAGSISTRLRQPLCYYRMTVPAIIYAYARWKAGIDVADIDAASFTAADSHCLGNNYFFTPSFVGRSSLEIIRELCESSDMVFLYSNGARKLACGYFYHPPTSADWTLREGDVISIKSYSHMLDRERPMTVNYGWDARHIMPCSPKFGWGKAAFTDTLVGMASKDEYDLEWFDQVSGWPDHEDLFVDFGYYLRLEVEVGLAAYAWDIDEVVEVFNDTLGLGIDPDYHDYFRIHKIRYNLRTMTATVTMVKHKMWNI